MTVHLCLQTIPDVFDKGYLHGYILPTVGLLTGGFIEHQSHLALYIF